MSRGKSRMTGSISSSDGSGVGKKSAGGRDETVTPYFMRS